MFWCSIFLLCGKNFLLRKRNKVRVVFEVLTPIIMFLILVQLRKLGEKKIVPDCHFKPKAMPLTAGFIPFVQGLYCSLNNTCEETVFNGSLQIYEDSLVSTVERALRESLDFKQLSDSFKVPLNRDIENITDATGDNSRPEFLLNDGKISLRRLKREFENKVDNTTKNNFSKFFFGNYVKTLQNFIINEKPKTSDIYPMFKMQTDKETFSCGDGLNVNPSINFNTTFRFINQTLKEIQNNETLADIDIEGIINFSNYLLCGKNVPSLTDQLNSILNDVSGPWTKRKEELESYSSSLRSSKGEPFPYENDTTEFCNEIMRKIEINPDFKLIWKLVKPFFRGKIVYTPTAPVINRLMGRVGRMFNNSKTSIEGLVTTVDWISNVIYKNNSQDFESNTKSFIKNFTTFSEEDINKVANRIINFIKQLENYKFYEYINCVDWDRLVAVEDREEAVDEALHWLESERLLVMVEFVNVNASAETLPHSLVYKLRTGIDRVHATFQIRDRLYRPRVRRDPVLDLKDITQGFAYIQHLIESEIIREFTGRTFLPGVYLKQTPYPCHVKDLFRESITRTLPMFMMISWIFLFSLLVKKIVYEKEKKIKQTLFIIGVNNIQQWIAWFLDAFLPMVFISLILSIIMVYGEITPASNVFIIWIFLSTFILPTIALAFLISTLFTKSSLAAATAGLLFILLYMPYPPLSQFEELLHPNIKIAVCLISNIAFGFGCTWFANMEELGLGAQYDTINVSPVPGNPISITLVLGFFILDAVIYFLLALYLEQVFPGGDGAGEKFYFFLMPSFWCSNRGNHSAKKIDSLSDDVTNDRVGISLINITKTFGRKDVLNNLNVKFFENEVTSFLGHNGAGKSTAISIMTGLMAPNSGSVKLYNRDLKDIPPKDRDIGLCPQENILFDELTIEEHLILYSRLKGLPKSKALSESQNVIKDLKVSGHRYKEVRHLSGGTQRKLCIAIAFTGNSRIVILDEPTAGVDPSSRRAIWDLIINYKPGRTVILTTHLMDEADLLGDKIIIIVRGEVVCSGSPATLKKNMGNGYFLTIQLDSENRSFFSSHSSEQIDALRSTIEDLVLGTRFLEQRGLELRFQLPVVDNVNIYCNLFETLNDRKELLKIKSYGISDTSLEDIFLRICREKEVFDGNPILVNRRKQPFFLKFADFPAYELDEKSDCLQDIENSTSNISSHACDNCSQYNSQRGKNQLASIFIKRTLHYWRNYRALLVQTVVPAIFIILAVYVSGLLPNIRLMPPLVIDISAYSPSNLFYSLDYPHHPMLKTYEKSLLSPQGFGTKCVTNPNKCWNNSISFGQMVQNTQDGSLNKCSCPRGKYVCDEVPPKPPSTMLSTGDRLFNLTGRNISNWIIKTELSESHLRYGGITLGHINLYSRFNLSALFSIFDFQKLAVKVASQGFRDWKDPIATTKFLMSACSPTVGNKLAENIDIYDNIIVWFNNRGWISALAFLNGVNNMILRASLPTTEDPSEYAITLINHPLPVSKRQFEDNVEKRSNITLLRALSIVVALAFVPAMYCVYIIDERESGFKHLLFLGGVGRLKYWLISLIWDFCFFLTTILVILVVCACFNEHAYIGSASIGVFLLILLSYSFVSITIVYPVSFYFRVPSSGFVVVASVNVFIGIATLLTSFILDIIADGSNPYYLTTLFLVFPQFCVGRSLMNMAQLGIRLEALRELGVVDFPDYSAWDVSMKFVVCMILQGVAFFAITLIIEFGLCVSHDSAKQMPVEDIEDESDVGAERLRIENSQTDENTDVLIVKNLTKTFSRGHKPAVNNICFGVPKGECFGLLGLNGAGKSTIFKMLTGMLRPTNGTINILNRVIMGKQVNLPIGYCPQTNPLDDYLTPAEHLSVFGRLYGLKNECLKAMVCKNLKRVNLQMHCFKLASALSGGNKRKLSSALAMCSEAPILLLDEPTTGMDPGARRLFWKCIQNCVTSGQSVILTSHSMEECQTLCTQLTIVVNGKLQCFGTSQHLKNKYDKGYGVTIRAPSLSALEGVCMFLSKDLPGGSTDESHYLEVKYTLKPGTPLSDVFKCLDRAQKENILRDYSISQTTLEQIFLDFAKYQDDSCQKPVDLFCCQYCFKLLHGRSSAFKHHGIETNRTNIAISSSHRKADGPSVINGELEPLSGTEDDKPTANAYAV